MTTIFILGGTLGLAFFGMVLRRAWGVIHQVEDAVHLLRNEVENIQLRLPPRYLDLNVVPPDEEHGYRVRQSHRHDWIEGQTLRELRDNIIKSTQAGLHTKIDLRMKASGWPDEL